MAEGDNQSGSAGRKRVLMCMGPFCNTGQRAERNAEILKPLLEDINAAHGTLYITLDFSGCMSMCGAGPNWIIEPGEHICNHVEHETDIHRIVDEHLRD